MPIHPDEEDGTLAHDGPEEGWEIVTVADTLLEAEVAADAMEEAEIPVSIESVGQRSHEVLVPEEHLARAREVLRTLREGDGEPSRVYRNRIEATKLVAAGRLALDTDELEAALERFQAAAKLDPRSAPARVGISVIRRKQGDRPGAYDELKAATALDGHDRNAWMALASLCMDLERYDEACHAYDKVLEIYPEDVRAHRGKGVAFAVAWRLAEGIRCFETALDIDPDDIESLVQDGMCRYRLGDFARAVERAEDALELDPEHRGALVLLGRAQWRNSDWKESDRALSAALEVAPESLEIQCYLAQTRIARGDFAGAQKLLDRVTAKNPELGLLKMTQARWHAATGNPKRDPASVERCLGEAVTRVPKNPDFQFALAEHLHAVGRGEEARRAAEEAARIAPEVPAYRDLLARLQAK